MAVTAVRFRRRVSGAAGAPGSLKSAEPAYNMADGKFYIGFGDNGSGGATSVKCFGKDDFLYNLPAGTNGYILGFTGGAPVWIAPPEGAIYTPGAGLTLNEAEFAVNFGVVAALASPAFGGTPTAPTAAAGTNNTQLATTAYVTTAIAAIVNGAGAAYDTLAELQALIEADADGLASLVTTVAGKLAKSANLSDLTDASAARGNLGLAGMATQAPNSVAITGGTIAGVDIDGGTF